MYWEGITMKYELKTELSHEEYEQFTKKADVLSFMQEYQWANVKDGWKHFHCGLYRDQELVATALVLLRNLPLGIKLMYIPRGMLIDYEDKELLQVLTKHLKELAKRTCLCFEK